MATPQFDQQIQNAADASEADFRDFQTRKLAESLYETHIAPIREELRIMTEQRDKMHAALEKIKSIRWGNDGDCGAKAIAEDAL